ncbi:MAG: LysM peptidoglycan-binding domain-containing protein [Cyclobacteriaceae bacterium]|nr:LysM peptidoglycan-binding domain-containing protein [Cyclobacteriaceae bacterium]
MIRRSLYMRMLISFLCCLVSMAVVVAQGYEDNNFEEEDAIDDGLIIFSVSEYEYVPDVSYEEMERRITSIESSIPLHFNSRVKTFVDYFTIKNRAYTKTMIARKNVYFPIFESVFANYDVPEEIKYLSIIESGFKVNARSRMGAVGLWQFMPATGRLYGLQQDWYVDERMDPYKSTEAACRYLKFLYGMFHDWELALAAYNCGPGNVKKAMKRSGKKTFWEIYNYLPRETRSYLPQFVAITYVMNFAEEHNLYVDPQDFMFDIASDTLHVKQFINFSGLAEQLNICKEDLEILNPQIKNGAVPGNKRTHIIRVPTDVAELLAENRQIILDSAGKQGHQKYEQLASQSAGSIQGRERIVHTVKSGDVLGSIAQNYSVNIADLREWNNLNGNIIRVGQKLNVWVTENQASRLKPQPQVAPLIVEGKKIHIVQPGDTLWNISRQYDNLSIEKIKELNKLDNNNIKPGQKLIIG